MGNTLLMEQLLREAIKLKPDYAIAYNALGYSYAERNIRLDEAKRNIEIALSIQPKNHYILDSMGWVHFKLGNIKIAYEFLKKAYAIQEDSEIAAHLGEVLWKQDKKEEAKQVLKKALSKDPDNKILTDVITNLAVPM
jgi:Tfp pilus assembly protein PilF